MRQIDEIILFHLMIVLSENESNFTESKSEVNHNVSIVNHIRNYKLKQTLKSSQHNSSIQPLKIEAMSSPHYSVEITVQFRDSQRLNVTAKLRAIYTVSLRKK